MCIVGEGVVLGDMAVADADRGAGPAHRSASVISLTELLVYKTSLVEFRKRLPPDVLQVCGDIACLFCRTCC